MTLTSSTAAAGGFFNKVLTGTLDVGFPATALATVQVAIFQIVIQNDPNSTQPVFIGNSLEGQFFQLNAGDNITLPVNNLNLIFARTDGTTQTINWIAMA